MVVKWPYESRICSYPSCYREEHLLSSVRDWTVLEIYYRKRLNSISWNFWQLKFLHLFSVHNSACLNIWRTMLIFIKNTCRMNKLNSDWYLHNLSVAIEMTDSFINQDLFRHRDKNDTQKPALWSLLNKCFVQLNIFYYTGSAFDCRHWPRLLEKYVCINLDNLAQAVRLVYGCPVYQDTYDTDTFTILEPSKSATAAVLNYKLQLSFVCCFQKLEKKVK